MNLGLSDSLKVLFPNVIPVQRPARAQRATVAAWEINRRDLFFVIFI
jgi:hypothetical protein